MGPDTNQCAFIGRNSKKIRLKTCPEQQSRVTPGLTAPQAELQEKGGEQRKAKSFSSCKAPLPSARTAPFPSTIAFGLGNTKSRLQLL